MENSAFLPTRAARLSLSTLLGAFAWAAFPLDSGAQSAKGTRAAPMELTQPVSATPWTRYGLRTVPERPVPSALPGESR